MAVRPIVSSSLRLILAASAASLVLASPAQAQRRIQGLRYGSGPLYQNPAGHALGSGAVSTPDGQLGRDVLGSGNALDSSLQVGSGGNNFARSSGYSYRDIQARNLVVTNGVAGGRGFRGEVNYYAPGDFAAPTGDTTYSYRRDAALSGLDYITSPQQRDAFNIAQGVGVFQYRRDFTSLPAVNTVNAASRIDDAQIRLDRSTTALQTGNLFTTAVAPADIGLVRMADDQVVRATASPVRGIQYESAAFRPTSLYDQALINDAMIREEQPTELGLTPEAFDALRDVAGAPGSDPTDARITSPSMDESAYQAILERVYQQYEGRDDVVLDTAGLTRMRQDFDRLDARVDRPRIGTAEDDRPDSVSERRTGLPGDRRPDPGLQVGPGDGEPGEDGAMPGDLDGMPSAADGGEAPTEGAGDEESTVRTVQELMDALAHRTQVTELVDPRMRARVAEIVGQAEEAMRERDYFRAEDRFDLALLLNPGNPMIEAGRANAQIGAGLYRSAGVTLVGLFRKHESMIDVGYDEALLPTRTRLRLAAQSIENLIQKDPEGSSGLGIVVAYIGRQLGERAMIERGLDAIEDPRVTSMVETLRGVWLNSRPIEGMGDAGGE